MFVAGSLLTLHPVTPYTTVATVKECSPCTPNFLHNHVYLMALLNCHLWQRFTLKCVSVHME